MAVAEWAAVIGPGVTGLAAWLLARRRNAADATKAITETTLMLLEPVKTELAEVRDEFRDFRAATKERARKHVEQFDKPLVREVRRLGGRVPEPSPLFDD